MSHPRPAEVFPPGEFLRDELAERGWSQEDLARIIKRPTQVVNQIINARKAVTPETAVALAAALDTSPDFWLNLENAYRLALVGQADPEISARAKKFAKALQSDPKSHRELWRELIPH